MLDQHKFTDLTSQESAIVNSVLSRKRNLCNKHGELWVAYDRCGRFTLCILSPRKSLNGPIYWGACRIDSRDVDDPQRGREIALAKAARMLAKDLF